MPIMHAPGEIAQVANMFDPRIFEDTNPMQSEPNIEFHIHAFLSPNSSNGPQRHQEVGVGPDGGRNRPPANPNAEPVPQSNLVSSTT